MDKTGFETRRNTLHLLFGLATVALVYAGVFSAPVLLAIVLAGLVISPASRNRKVPVISWFIDRFERDEVKDSFPGKGTIYFFMGSLIAVAVFPRAAALAAITILAIGDSVSPIVGMRTRRIKHPISRAKFLEGSAAGFLLAFAGASLFVPMAQALAATFAAFIIEGVDYVRGVRIEDNITIPFFAGLVIWLMSGGMLWT